MTVSLPMYMRDELLEAHHAFYGLIRKHLHNKGIDSPAQITQPLDLYNSWTSPDLLLSQTCGMPYRLRLHRQVKLIGTPDYQLEGCTAGYYRSAIIVRRDSAEQSLAQYQNAVFTYNAKDSQSGYAAAYQHARRHGFWFEKKLPSGSHQNSAVKVAEGVADIAAIDAMTWRLLQKYERFTDTLTVLDWTDPTPGLPYITSITQDDGLLFDAVSAAIAELTPGVRALLHLYSLEKIDADDYLSVSTPPDMIESQW